MLSSLPGASGPGSVLEFRAAVLDPGPELLAVGLASLQSLSSGLFLVLILGQSTLVLRAEHSDVKIPLFGYYFYRKLGMACGLGATRSSGPSWKPPGLPCSSVASYTRDTGCAFLGH